MAEGKWNDPLRQTSARQVRRAVGVFFWECTGAADWLWPLVFGLTLEGPEKPTTNRHEWMRRGRAAGKNDLTQRRKETKCKGRGNWQKDFNAESAEPRRVTQRICHKKAQRIFAMNARTFTIVVRMGKADKSRAWCWQRRCCGLSSIPGCDEVASSDAAETARASGSMVHCEL